MGALRFWDGDEWVAVKGKDGETIVGPKGDAGDILNIAALGTATRDGLELLQGDERLDSSAIKGLDERFKPLEARARQVQTPAKSYAIHTKDVSSQCDGNNTSFNVGGLHFGIIGVFSTEAPIIYRPVIDYTETRNGITLTNSVSAPQAGQTLIIQYLK